jgi:hypothetical protein
VIVSKQHNTTYVRRMLFYAIHAMTNTPKQSLECKQDVNDSLLA